MYGREGGKEGGGREEGKGREGGRKEGRRTDLPHEEDGNIDSNEEIEPILIGDGREKTFDER